jgi:IS5 family transposase
MQVCSSERHKSLQNMKPETPDTEADLFCSQLSQSLNLKHRLCRLAEQIDWTVFEKEFGALFDPDAGRPGLSTRLMVGLHHLKYVYNESGESVVARWLENPYWQYFCGFAFLQHERPLHPTSLVKWRQRMGPQRLELLLTHTIAVARRGGAVRPQSLSRGNVDTTVAEKAVAFPTDARLCHKMRVALVRAARQRNIRLRESYRRVGQAGLDLARPVCQRPPGQTRPRPAAQTQNVYLGRVVRGVQRKSRAPDDELRTLLRRAEHLLAQQPKDKDKIYRVHAPEVECIAKGKAHKRYEFGCKVSIASTSADNWLIGAQALPGRPYDGHTLTGALAQVTDLTGASPRPPLSVKATEAIVIPERRQSMPWDACPRRRHEASSAG